LFEHVHELLLLQRHVEGLGIARLLEAQAFEHLLFVEHCPWRCFLRSLNLLQELNYVFTFHVLLIVEGSTYLIDEGELLELERDLVVRYQFSFGSGLILLVAQGNVHWL
jgi:hypothetical protein